MKMRIEQFELAQRWHSLHWHLPGIITVIECGITPRSATVEMVASRVVCITLPIILPGIKTIHSKTTITITAWAWLPTVVCCICHRPATEEVRLGRWRGWKRRRRNRRITIAWYIRKAKLAIGTLGCCWTCCATSICCITPTKVYTMYDGLVPWIN